MFALSGVFTVGLFIAVGHVFPRHSALEWLAAIALFVGVSVTTWWVYYLILISGFDAAQLQQKTAVIILAILTVGLTSLLWGWAGMPPTLTDVWRFSVVTGVFGALVGWWVPLGSYHGLLLAINWRRRALRNARPEAAMIVSLIKLIDYMEYPPTRADLMQRRRATRLMEVVARSTERLLIDSVAPGDTYTRERVRARALAIATAVRDLKMWIVAPGVEQLVQAVVDTAHDARARRGGQLGPLSIPSPGARGRPYRESGAAPDQDRRGPPAPVDSVSRLSTSPWPGHGPAAVVGGIHRLFRLAADLDHGAHRQGLL